MSPFDIDNTYPQIVLKSDKRSGKEIIDQIGGWSSSDVGESYGDGHRVLVLSNWLYKISKPNNFSVCQASLIICQMKCLE